MLLLQLLRAMIASITNNTTFSEILFARIQDWMRQKDRKEKNTAKARE